MALHVHSVGPGVTVQDLGRPGWTAQGLSRGGAVDRHAVLSGAALLDAPADFAVLEMMGFGGSFSVTQDTRIALTGATMQADIAGTPIAPQMTHLLRAGQRLTIGGARQGVFGYLAFAGGLRVPKVMDSRATHLTAGIGGPLQAGDVLPLGSDPDPFAGPQRLPMPIATDDPIRIMPGPQSDYFAPETIKRFAQTAFIRSPHGNRQGTRLDHMGDPFRMDGASNIVSDLVLPGDVQMTGEGIPYILMAECQTIGGYPRIGTIIPADLPRLAQIMPGAPVCFAWVSVAEADASAQSDAQILDNLRRSIAPATRDPHDIADLLSYQLISGVTRGDDLDRG